MSEAADVFKGVGLDALLAYHGEAVTYTPKGGSGRSFLAIWTGRDARLEPRADGVRKVFEGLLTVVLSSDETVGVGDPGTGDTVLVGGETFTVIEDQGRDDVLGVAALRCERSVLVEVEREGSRL